MKEPIAILLVDSDQQSVSSIMSIVPESEYLILKGETGKEALERCSGSAGSVAYAFIDMHLSDMSGPELYSRLLARHPDLSVAFMTSDLETAKVMTRQGYVILQKPLDKDVLLGKLRELLTRAAIHKAA